MHLSLLFSWPIPLSHSSIIFVRLLFLYFFLSFAYNRVVNSSRASLLLCQFLLFYHPGGLAWEQPYDCLSHRMNRALSIQWIWLLLWYMRIGKFLVVYTPLLLYDSVIFNVFVVKAAREEGGLHLYCLIAVKNLSVGLIRPSPLFVIDNTRITKPFL